MGVYFFDSLEFLVPGTFSKGAMFATSSDGELKKV